MVMPMSEAERKYWKEREKRYIERCKERNEKDPPKNLAHKAGRFIWHLLWMPTPPTY